MFSGDRLDVKFKNYVVQALGGRWRCLAQAMACWLVKYHTPGGMVCVCGGGGGEEGEVPASNMIAWWLVVE